MSGTSCDGVDLALIEITDSSDHFKFLKGYHKPYNKTQKNTILDCINPQQSSIEKISQINFYLAQIWAEAINEMLSQNNISKDEIDLIGNHGQTIYHQP